MGPFAVADLFGQDVAWTSPGACRYTRSARELRRHPRPVVRAGAAGPQDRGRPLRLRVQQSSKSVPHCRHLTRRCQRQVCSDQFGTLYSSLQS
ncbi:hypothetical protein [Polaromonas sp. UC242_47]|uniref:hypothetical protein n=1 Tax=Polaromonas sp. UC242_47 TaxID=3374626 RepID=UPI0037B8F83D